MNPIHLDNACFGWNVVSENTQVMTIALHSPKSLQQFKIGDLVYRTNDHRYKVSRVDELTARVVLTSQHISYIMDKYKDELDALYTGD